MRNMMTDGVMRSRHKIKINEQGKSEAGGSASAVRSTKRTAEAASGSCAGGG